MAHALSYMSRMPTLYVHKSSITPIPLTQLCPYASVHMSVIVCTCMHIYICIYINGITPTRKCTNKRDHATCLRLHVCVHMSAVMPLTGMHTEAQSGPVCNSCHSNMCKYTSRGSYLHVHVCVSLMMHTSACTCSCSYKRHYTSTCMYT